MAQLFRILDASLTVNLSVSSLDFKVICSPCPTVNPQFFSAFNTIVVPGGFANSKSVAVSEGLSDLKLIF